MLFDLFVTLFLVALNGFFVATEFAFVKVRASQVELRAASGNRLDVIAKHIIDHIDKYLSATQLGITLASLGLGWFGETVTTRVIIRLFGLFGVAIDPAFAHSLALPFAFVLITVLHIVFGELLPKRYAIRYPEKVAYATAIPLRLFYTIFGPFIWLLNKFADFLMRTVGLPTGDSTDAHSEEEILHLVRLSRDRGEIRSSEQELIERVFHFDERLVKQILVPRTRMVLLDLEASKEEIIDTLLREGYSRLPIYSKARDNIVGVVNSKDLLKVVSGHGPLNLRDILRPAYFVPETKRINELLRDFQRKKIHIAIVVDEFGAISGLVTLEDIVEELVGEIQDEHDEESPVCVKRSDTEFVANAFSSITDINKHLPVELPEGSDYATLGGLVHILFGSIPDERRTKRFGAYEFTILKKSERSVESVLLRLLPVEERTSIELEG